MASFLEEYASEEEESASPEEQPAKARAIKRHRKWELVRIFDEEAGPDASREAALCYMKESGGGWASYNINKSKKFQKEYFRCTVAKRRGEQCMAGRILMYPSHDTTVHLLATTCDHNHDQLRNKITLPKEARDHLWNLFDINDDSNSIWEAAGKEHFDNRRQLTNLLSTFRTKKYGPTEISVPELIAWCKKHSVFPKDENEMFVLAMDIGNNETHVRVLISTKKLLNETAQSDLVHADGTYKMVWQGFPLIVIGTTDRTRKFVLGGLAICHGETTDDYKFAFQGMKDAYKDLGIRYSFKVLIADAAPAIRNGFQAVFGEVTVVMCYFHMKKCIKDHLGTKDWAIAKATRTRILFDLDRLHLCCTKEHFSAAAQLFTAKWNGEGCNEFVRYFKTNWLEKNNNWYEGASPGSPSTNNALESFNNIIKKKATLRKKLPLSRFIILMQGKIEMWSRDMSFNSEPMITQKTWLAAYTFIKQKRKIEEKFDGDESHILCPAVGTVVNHKHVDTSRRCDWRTFDEFATTASSCYFITFINNRDNWLSSTCSCRVFQKTYVCKHIVGIAVIKKYLTVPPAIKAIPIGGKVGPGRPPKAKKAWQR